MTRFHMLTSSRVIISAFRRIPRASWNAKERLWMFPLSSLSEAEKLEVVKDKIKSPKSKDESESLKFTQKNLINKIYTNSADAKIPAVLEYLGTVIEVLLPSAASKQENVNKELVTAPVCTIRKSSRLQVFYICAPSANDRCDT
ncbi:uncharacterized protein [Arachis hypogaea]|uniref:uncharacterized protein isoform X4 n=1 Tax=Arachis hypogaea TaxID=3818 RepID=UPI003B218022